MLNWQKKTTRRRFLELAGAGMALGATDLRRALAAAAEVGDGQLLAPKPSHFAPRAKRVVFLCRNGGFSQVDTFDYKPELQKNDDKKVAAKPKRPAASLIDGIPEWFVGLLLSELVAHEVGHTLGLRHNFKSSSVYSLAEINNGTLKGKKPFAGSVMDYIPVNMSARMGKNPAKGDHTMIDIGPYDLWAIEYGYTFSKDLKKILARVAEPELAYATDEDTGGPDPLARRYDFSKNPLDYAKAQLDLVQYHRGRLLEKFVKSGDSWSKARR